MKTTLTALFIFSAFFAFSQHSVNKGKIFLTDKTLDGFVSILASEGTPQEFLFSEKVNGSFLPVTGNITRVEFENGLIYEPYLVKISVLSNDYLSRRSVDYDKNIINQVKFLQNLLTGIYNLYFLRDEYGFQHFFYKANGDKEVIYLQNNSYVDEHGMYFQDNAYRNQAGFLFKKQHCSVSENMLSTVKYDISSLPLLFKKLNACGGGNSTDNYRKQNKTKFLPGVLAGVLYKSIQPDASSPDWQRPLVAAGGIYLLMEPEQGRKGTGYGVDIIFNSIKSQSGYRTSPATYPNFKGYYEYTGIDINPFVRFYTGGGTNFRTYISAGLDLPMSFTSSYYLKDANNTTYQFKSGNNGKCLVGAIGGNWKNLSAEINIGTTLGLFSKSGYYGFLVRYSVLK